MTSVNTSLSVVLVKHPGKTHYTINTSCPHLHSTTRLHNRNSLQELRVPLVLIHSFKKKDVCVSSCYCSLLLTTVLVIIFCHIKLFH